VGSATLQVAAGYNTLRPFPKDRRFVAAGSADSANAVTIYSPERGNLVVKGVLHGHRTEVRSVATDGEIIASGDSAGGIWLWRAGTNDPLCPGGLAAAHGGRVFGLAICADHLVSGASDKTVRLWSIREAIKGKTCVATLTEHSHLVFGVDVDTEAIASASHDKTARVWLLDQIVTGGKSTHTFVHKDLVVAVHINGDTLATACEDKVVRLWSLSRGKQTHEMRGHRDHVVSVTIGGSLLLSGSSDGTVKLWSLPAAASSTPDTGDAITTVVEDVVTLTHAKEGQGGGPVQGVAFSVASGLVASLSASGAAADKSGPKFGNLVVWESHEQHTQNVAAVQHLQGMWKRSLKERLLRGAAVAGSFSKRKPTSNIT